MTSRARTILVLLTLAPVPALSGCAVVAWTVAAWTPPKKVPAECKVPENKTILVFVDDIIHEVVYEPVKMELTVQLNKQLVEHKVAGRTVKYDRLLDLIAAAPKFNRLSVSEVGQKLGADIVLYVQVDKFSLKDSNVSPLWHGQLQTTVRIVEVGKGRLWPKDRPAGHTVEPLDIPTSDETSRGYGSKLARIMARQMAHRIAKLFYEHKEAREGTLRD